MSVCLGSTCSTRPTEFILTKSTSHVVAALVLFDLRSAHGAKRDIAGILLSPAFKLSVHRFFTRYMLTMPDVTALIADFRATFLANKLYFLVVFCTNRCTTACLWTKAHQRIFFKIFSCLEASIFLVKVSRKPALEIVVFNWTLAWELEALYRLDLAILNSLLTVLYNAFCAKAMSASELCCTFWVFSGDRVSVTYRTIVIHVRVIACKWSSASRFPLFIDK